MRRWLCSVHSGVKLTPAPRPSRCRISHPRPVGLRHFFSPDGNSIFASVAQARIPVDATAGDTEGTSHLSFRRAIFAQRNSAYFVLRHEHLLPLHTYRIDTALTGLHALLSESVRATTIYEVDQDNQQTPGRPQCESARRLLQLATRVAIRTSWMRVTDASGRQSWLFRGPINRNSLGNALSIFFPFRRSKELPASLYVSRARPRTNLCPLGLAQTLR